MHSEPCSDTTAAAAVPQHNTSISVRVKRKYSVYKRNFVLACLCCRTPNRRTTCQQRQQPDNSLFRGGMVAGATQLRETTAVRFALLVLISLPSRHQPPCVIVVSFRTATQVNGEPPPNQRENWFWFCGEKRRMFFSSAIV